MYQYDIAVVDNYYILYIYICMEGIDGSGGNKLRDGADNL